MCAATGSFQAQMKPKSSGYLWVSSLTASSCLPTSGYQVQKLPAPAHILNSHFKSTCLGPQLNPLWNITNIFCWLLAWDSFLVFLLSFVWHGGMLNGSTHNSARLEHTVTARAKWEFNLKKFIQEWVKILIQICLDFRAEMQCVKSGHRGWIHGPWHAVVFWTQDRGENSGQEFMKAFVFPSSDCASVNT